MHFYSRFVSDIHNNQLQQAAIRQDRLTLNDVSGVHLNDRLIQERALQSRAIQELAQERALHERALHQPSIIIPNHILTHDRVEDKTLHTIASPGV